MCLDVLEDASFELKEGSDHEASKQVSKMGSTSSSTNLV